MDWQIFVQNSISAINELFLVLRSNIQNNDNEKRCPESNRFLRLCNTWQLKVKHQLALVTRALSGLKNCVICWQDINLAVTCSGMEDIFRIPGDIVGVDEDVDSLFLSSNDGENFVFCNDKLFWSNSLTKSVSTELGLFIYCFSTLLLTLYQLSIFIVQSSRRLIPTHTVGNSMLTAIS